MNQTRKEWLERMHKIAYPVLSNFANNTFKETFPFAFHHEKKDFAMLEALGRTLTGIAPWLELPGLAGDEQVLQAEYRKLAVQAVSNAVDAKAKDYVNFSRGKQPLVDAAFLAHGLVRAPKQLAAGLPEQTRKNLLRELKATRKIVAYGSNWLFFSAMVEAGLKLLGAEDADELRVMNVFDMFGMWYQGDGVYGDGPMLHCDYYNSFVIHPMYVDLLEFFRGSGEDFSGRRYETIRAEERVRAARYASVLERSIAPDGTYPIIGRSVCYRFGAFHMLSQAALEHMLEGHLAPAQVRCGLTAVLKKVMENPAMFDDQGWLRPGVYGHQPELAEEYINNGSLYLCCAIFLPLGLAPEDPFWADEDQDWTGKRIFSGQLAYIDQAILN